MKTLEAYRATEAGHRIVKDHPTIALREMLTDEIQHAYHRMGHNNATDAVIASAVIDMTEIVTEKYSGYSLDEVKEVLRLFALGDLGEYTHISARNLNIAFKTYHTTTRREIVEKNRLKTPRALIDEKCTYDHEYFRNQFKEAAAKWEPADIAMIPPRIFDIYHAHGIIKDAKKAMTKHISRATMEVQKEQRELPMAAKSIAAIVAERKAKSTEERITQWAKRLAVAEMYDLERLKTKVKTT